jgi:AcrR family transcriptional regulator
LGTRKYNLDSRHRKQAELKERIAAATAELHASRGATATSFVDIARQAGVSLPTVHSHFSSQNELFQGCTAHVADRAPALPVDIILEATELVVAIKLLVAAMEQQHLYYEPWLAWREDKVIPFLSEMSDKIRDQQAGIVKRLLRQHLGSDQRREMIAACESLLCFDFWYRLVRGHALSLPSARREIAQCLLAIIGPQPTSSSTSRPRRKT